MATYAGFLAFVRTQMQITTNDLPDNSPYVPAAYAAALEVVNQQIQQVSPLFYDLAVYNLGGSNIVNYAQDYGGSSFFAKLREKWNINAWAAGVVQSTSDVSTSTGLLIPKFGEGLTLADLQHLKDPWGRAYLQIAQRYGPLVGLT
jgi:hypothetical protein